MTASKEPGQDTQHVSPLISQTVFVTRYYPFPKRTGALIYTSHLIKLFSRISKSIEIVGSYYPDLHNRDASEEQSTSPGGKYFFHPVREAPMARVLLSPLPTASWPHSTSVNIKNIRRCLSGEPELIVLDHVGAIWAFREITSYLNTHPTTKLVYCTHNDEVATRLSQIDLSIRGLFRSGAIILDAAKIFFLERRLFSRIHLVTAITSEEASAYSRSGKETSVINPAYEGDILATRNLNEDTPRQVCICGSFLWSAKRWNLEAFLSANHDYLRDIGISIVVVGNMTEKFGNKVQNKWPGTVAEGRVPSITPYLRNSRLGLLVDEAGGGFKLKVLDYVFNRLPVAGLFRAAIGMPLATGRNSLLCENIEEMGPLIKEAIDDFPKLNAMQNNAFDEFKKFTTIEEPLERLREALLPKF